MKGRLLTSKLHIPRINGCGIKREELLAKIQNIPEQVVVLHAGTGWGKTCLLASYVQVFQIPYSWYQIGHMDNDINQFIRYFTAMLRLQVESFQLPELPEEWSQKLTEDVATCILEQMELWDGTVTLILDDFQYINNPLIYDFLSCFISHMSERIRLFFLIKGPFPGFLTRFVLQGIVRILKWQDLRITERELTEYFKTTGTDMDEQGFTQPLIHYTEGWPVAVNFWLMQNAGERNEDIKDFFLTSAFSDYLVYEILQSLTVKQKIFMEESSLLNSITSETCTYILEMESSKRLLEEFVNHQLPIRRYNKEEYYYHPILRDFLREQVKEGRKQEIWKRAVRFHRERKEEVFMLLYLEDLEQEFKEARWKKKESFEREERLALQCFGDIQVCDQLTGNRIRWRTKKTKEMFAYFWEKKERALSKEEIMDALWQEGGGQNLESLFHTTLSYLKRAFSEIGISDMIQVENKKYVMSNHYFTADVQKFVKLYDMWKDNREKLEIEQAFTELVQIYQGDYMEELDSSWIVVSREYYRGIYMKSCEFLIECAQADRNYALVIRILEELLKMDPYSEQFNGMLLKALGEIGEFQQVQQQYEHYLRLMQEELNIETGRQIQEIYQTVMLRRIG